MRLVPASASAARGRRFAEGLRIVVCGLLPGGGSVAQLQSLRPRRAPCMAPGSSCIDLALYASPSNEAAQGPNTDVPPLKKSLSFLLHWIPASWAAYIEFGSANPGRIALARRAAESPRRSLRRYLGQVGAAEASRNPQSPPGGPRPAPVQAVRHRRACYKLISYPPSLHKTPASPQNHFREQPARPARRSRPARRTGLSPPHQSAGSPSSTRAAPSPAARVACG